MNNKIINNKPVRAQVNMQATVYLKLKKPKIETETHNETGIVNTKIVKEIEFDLNQFAILFNELPANEREVDMRMMELSKHVKETMRRAGLIL